MAKTFRSMTTEFSQEKLAVICEKAIERFDELLAVLGVELKRQNRMYVGCCPVHGGDRDNAFNLFHTGDTMTGNWKCRSHQCQETFKPTLLGFVRGVLSHKQKGWEHNGDDTFSFVDTVKFLLNFIDKNYDDLHVDLDQVEKTRAAEHVTRYYARKTEIKNKIARTVVRQHIKSPDYFIQRGFSPAILDKYDVTFCDDPSKEMYKRCVAPIYDDDHKFMVGYTGRSIFEKCECKGFHNSNFPCPLPEDAWRYSKWKHNYGFKAEEWLYNYWYAKRFILETKCAVLVESPGNVWRLEEAGIHNSLGLFGNSLTPGQFDALNKCGAMNILIALDNDEAGISGTQYLIRDLSKLYNIEVLKFEGGDIGEMSVDDIKTKLAPKIEGAYIL